MDGWTEGRAVRYGPTVMARVALNRGIPWQPCMVAWTYAKDEDMGRKWLLVEGVKTGVRKRCLVVDLPQPRDKANLIKRGIVVELDARSSRAICPPGWDGAARLCAVRVKEVP
jgi:hypothetical protein